LLSDIDGSGNCGLAVLGVEEVSGKVLVQVKNAATGSRVKDISFNKAWTPCSLAMAPDVDANPGAELALMGLNESTGKVTVDVKDALTGTLVKSVSFTSCGAPQGMAVVLDTNGKGVCELAVLGMKKDADTTAVELRDALTGKWLRIVPIP
jgi:hypothetical protein